MSFISLSLKKPILTVFQRKKNRRKKRERKSKKDWNIKKPIESQTNNKIKCSGLCVTFNSIQLQNWQCGNPSPAHTCFLIKGRNQPFPIVRKSEENLDFVSNLFTPPQLYNVWFLFNEIVILFRGFLLVFLDWKSKKFFLFRLEMFKKHYLQFLSLFFFLLKLMNCYLYWKK